MEKAHFWFMIFVVLSCMSLGEAAAQIVIKDSDSTWGAELTPSKDLVIAGRTVSPRMITECADSSFSRNLIKPEKLAEAAKSVPRRVIAEYANSFFSRNLQKPEGLESAAKTVSPRIIVEGVDSTLFFNICDPFRPIQPVSIKGDINKDGVVDVADLIIVGLHLGESPPTDPRADANSDGRVDILDLVIVAKHFGEQAAAAPAKNIWNIDSSQLSVLQEICKIISRVSSSDPNCVLVLELLDRLMASAIEKPMLHQNYPNPCNPETWIPYQLKEGSEVTIRIFNIAGNLVRKLRLGYKPAGVYVSRERAAYWDGKNETGEPVASGVYFYTIQAGEFTATRKLIVVK